MVFLETHKKKQSFVEMIQISKRKFSVWLQHKKESDASFKCVHQVL